MPASATSVVERIARVIAGQRLSVNADGGETSAATSIDMEWAAYVDDAYAILKTFREPDQTMAEAGNLISGGRWLELLWRRSSSQAKFSNHARLGVPLSLLVI